MLLRIKRTCFQSGVQLGDWHWRRVHAQELESLDVIRIGGRANFQPLQIFRLVDWALVVCESAPAVFPVGQTFHAMRCQFVQNTGTYCTIEHVVSVSCIAEYKGQFHGRCVGHDAVVVGGTARHDVDGAAAHAVDHGGIVAQLVGWENRNLYVAVGALFDQLCQFKSGSMLTVCGVHSVAHFEIELGSKCSRAHASDQASNENARNFHGVDSCGCFTG